MEILYYLCVGFYMLGPHGISFYIGLAWHGIKNNHGWNPQTLLTVVYACHYMILSFVIKLPIIMSILSNIGLVVTLYFGCKFQMIGLTGGIGCGKSTVSKIFKE